MTKSQDHAAMARTWAKFARLGDTMPRYAEDYVTVMQRELMARGMKLLATDDGMEVCEIER